MNGHVILEKGKMPCLIVESVTEADELNLELWEKTLFLMKKLVIGSDNDAIKKFKAKQNGDKIVEEKVEKSLVLEQDPESEVEII
jgi:hypothetical protein